MTATVTVLVPVFNEARDIEDCIACIAAQDIGTAALEVFVIDGGSSDDTVALATARAEDAGFGCFAVLDNPERRTAPALARGLAAATTDHVVRVDARSRIPAHYVRTVVDVLAHRPDVGVVGGAQVPVDRSSSTVAAGIARALSNKFTTGLGRYRRSDASGPADTVWMGAFRTADLRRVGGWDPSHGINEDYELNERFRAAGFVVWFEGSLRSGYVPRPDLPSLARQYLAYGRSKGAAWRGGARPAPRQVALLVAPFAAGAAAVVATRRFGLVPTVLAGVAALFAIDEVGGPRRPATLAVRVASASATVTFSSAWLAGVAEGWAGMARR